MRCSYLVVFGFVVSLVKAAVLHPGFQPSLGPPTLNYPPVHPEGHDRDACALVLDGPGRSSLFDHTHSIFFGAGYIFLHNQLKY